MVSHNLVGSIVLFLDVHKLMVHLIIDGFLDLMKYGNKTLTEL